MILLYAYMGIVNAVTASVIGIIVLLQSRRKAVNRSFFAFMFSVVVWGLGYFFWLTATDVESALFWVRIFMLGAIFIPIAYFHFVTHFIKQSEQHRPSIIGGYCFGGISSIVLWTPLFVESVAPKLTFPFWPNPGMFFHPFLIIWFGFVVYGTYLLLRAYNQSRGFEKGHIKYIVFGSIVGYAGGATNFFLWYDIPVPPFGTLGVVFFVASVGYAIIRYRLFDFKVRSQQMFNALAPLVLALLFAMTVNRALPLFSIALPQANAIAFIVGIGAYELFRQIISRSRFGSLLLQNIYPYRQSLAQLANDALTIIDLDVLIERVMRVLMDDMKITRAAILISVNGNNEQFEIISANNFTEKQLSVLIEPKMDSLIAFEESITYLRDEIEFELDTENSSYRRRQLTVMRNVLHDMDAELVMALRVQQNIVGFIVLGPRVNDRLFTAEDIELLEEVSRQLAVAFVNSKLHHETERRANMLQKEVEHAVDAWKQKSLENQELSNVRSQFISVMSHQLRTPISVIYNSLDLVIEDYLSVFKNEDTYISKEQMQHISNLLQNALLASNNLKNTAESILSSSEMIGSVPALQIKRIGTHQFFQRRVNKAKRLLEAKMEDDVEFRVNLHEPLPERMVTDENKLATILDNLLSNAVLYTTNGHVAFDVSAHDGEFIISVADTGIGIPRNKQKHIFQRFIRMNNAQRVVPDGSGLGLYLAKAYTELLRGQIYFSSEEHEGTTFTVHIPVEYRYIAS